MRLSAILLDGTASDGLKGPMYDVRRYPGNVLPSGINVLGGVKALTDRDADARRYWNRSRELGKGWYLWQTQM